MGTMQVIKTGFSTVWKWGKSKCLRSKTSDIFAVNKNMTAPKDLPVDEFVRTTPKPPRAMTIEDITNFRSYLLAKKVDLKVTSEEIKTLFAYEGKEYELKAFEFLTKKMNIPKDLIPDYVYGTELQVPMYFDYVLNTIKVNPNFAEQFADKSVFLSTLRHELQHYVQNISMFRHETKGEELITLYAKLGAKNVRTNIDNYAKNLDMEQLKQIFDEEGMQEIAHLKDLLKNNKTEEYEKYLTEIEEKMYKRYVPIYSDFRKTIVEKLGILSKDSTEGKRAEKMFNETASEYSYWEKDGSVNAAGYFGDMREVGAMAAQDMMTLRLNAITSGNDKFCYLKILREAQEYMQKHLNELDPQIQELMQKSKQAPIEDKMQGVKYLYD